MADYGAGNSGMGNSGTMPGWAYALPVVGSVLQGLGQQQQAQQQQKQWQQQFGLQQNAQQWGQQMDATNMQRQLDADAYARANQNMTNPARVQVANALMQRMGLGAAFQEQKQGPVGPAVVQQAQNPLAKTLNGQLPPDQAAFLAKMAATPGLKKGALEAVEKDMRSRLPQTQQNYIPLGQAR